jgi:hypothetical protein
MWHEQNDDILRDAVVKSSVWQALDPAHKSKWTRSRVQWTANKQPVRNKGSKKNANRGPRLKKSPSGVSLSLRGFGLGTPEGEEGGGAAPGNTGRGAQATVHQTSSKFSLNAHVHRFVFFFTSKHGHISNRSPNQKE